MFRFLSHHAHEYGHCLYRPTFMSSAKNGIHRPLQMLCFASMPEMVPRAAVAVTVRCSIPSTARVPTTPNTNAQGQGQGQVEDDNDGSGHASLNRYLLIQRKNPPDEGKWALPGGKIDLGESTMDAARRELDEEVKFHEDVDLRWFHQPITSSDAITPNDDGSFAFHYVISQMLCYIPSAATLPDISPSDDAIDAKWWSREEIADATAKSMVCDGIVDVIDTAEIYFSNETMQFNTTELN